jgi:branched-subunit amino acid aminotransferase/4-amino-4-deoxychorismate lyase
MSNASVDPRIKQRSRLLWWLAEQEVHAVDPLANALLLDSDDHLTETAAANFLIVKNGVVMSPPNSTILNGVSLQVVRELCGELNIGFEERSLTVNDAITSEEALVTGTSFCVAGVSQIQDVDLPWPGSVWSRLLAAWSDRVGLDIFKQITA